MSGGSFNYAYARLNDFADEAEMKIASNNAPNRWGGKNLACFCRLDQLCHADVLLEFANKQ